jgi:hypothetical protein
MGGGRWSASDWDTYATTKVRAAKTVDHLYTSRMMHKDLDPKGVIRESRDSDDNPNSNAIIIALDVTGSMDPVLDQMARVGLPTLAEELYTHKPVSDPHLMFMGIGDANYDESPLQVTQFEADIRVAEQLQKIWLERHGGGNNSESYSFAWYFATYKTKIDCFEKRNKKGYLFTVGDEELNASLTRDQINTFIDDKNEDDVKSDMLINFVSKKYEVFHLIVKEGNHCRHSYDAVRNSWTRVLGQRAITLTDHTKMGEVISATIRLIEGENFDSIVSSHTDRSTISAITSAISDRKDLIISKNGKDSGIVVF